MKKNCGNCIHLEWYEADYEESNESGFSCNGREYPNPEQETKHLKQLENEGYLAKSKRCCELPKQIQESESRV